MTTTATAPVTNEQAPKTQIDTIRAHLMTGSSISTWDAYRLYRITCLAQRVHELKKSGLEIQSEMVTHNGKRFSLYWLDEATLLEVERADNADYEGTANAPV